MTRRDVVVRSPLQLAERRADWRREDELKGWGSGDVPTRHEPAWRRPVRTGARRRRRRRKQPSLDFEIVLLAGLLVALVAVTFGTLCAGYNPYVPISLPVPQAQPFR